MKTEWKKAHMSRDKNIQYSVKQNYIKAQQRKICNIELNEYFRRAYEIAQIGFVDDEMARRNGEIKPNSTQHTAIATKKAIIV